MVFGGLEGWEAGGFLLSLLFLLFLLFLLVLLVVFEQLLDQECDGAFALFGFADFGWRGEGA
jgi:hypothetical protein